MPVSKNNRKTKKVKKQKGYRPVRTLPGYKLVKETCQKIDDILFETAKLAKIVGVMEDQFSPEHKIESQAHLRAIIEVLAPGKAIDAQGVEVEYAAFPLRVSALEKEADKVAARAHADDLEFVPILNMAENYLSTLITGTGEAISQLAILVDTYAPREDGVSEVLEKQKEETDVQPA
ncbi:hypothetical protein CF95_gp241 [Erwinia phage PhiEaH1]|uniref:Uncharacterized protein n=1 Tax=Erwinia phage PhiEaH1 TaxID=1401669 RepID=W8D0K3_9CAUD|nr:hypothetical protein CF95_gp241 [Erwinia phage PhiEaH1]AGX01963.1 hypothetical protein [Erwinia phage PhiEaH1]